MDNRPIGVFDSGLGGLTAVKELMKVLPNENIVYFGDTGRVPYGSRSKETIIKYTRQDIVFLRSFDIKAVLAACGTVSTTALDTVAPECDVPVFGVAEAAAMRAAELTRNKRIGLIGTSASINSRKYEEIIKQKMPEAEVFGKACPLFVPLVENGRIKRGDKVIELVAAEYLQELKDAGVDTLILGCTHYPLLKDIIGDFMGDGVALIDPGAEAARYLAKSLSETDGLNNTENGGQRAYFVSDSAENFSGLASLFLETDVTDGVTQVSLDSF